MPTRSRTDRGRERSAAPATGDVISHIRPKESSILSRTSGPAQDPWPWDLSPTPSSVPLGTGLRACPGSIGYFAWRRLADRLYSARLANASAGSTTRLARRPPGHGRAGGHSWRGSTFGRHRLACIPAGWPFPLVLFIAASRSCTTARAGGPRLCRRAIGLLRPRPGAHRTTDGPARVDGLPPSSRRNIPTPRTWTSSAAARCSSCCRRRAWAAASGCWRAGCSRRQRLRESGAGKPPSSELRPQTRSPRASLRSPATRSSGWLDTTQLAAWGRRRRSSRAALAARRRRPARAARTRSAWSPALPFDARNRMVRAVGAWPRSHSRSPGAAGVAGARSGERTGASAEPARRGARASSSAKSGPRRELEAHPVERLIAPAPAPRCAFTSCGG